MSSLSSVRNLSDCVQPPTSPRSHATAYRRKRALLKTVDAATLRRTGLPHPPKDRFLMIPPAFGIILACEPLPVSQVIFEVLAHTIGYIGDGAHGRRDWVQLSYRHFERKGLMGRDTARAALTYAVQAGYLVTRPGHRRSTEYAVRWCDGDFVTP